MGHESELYALTIDDDAAGRRPAVRAIRPRERGDLTIFHYALPSPMTAAFAALARGRVLQYHNVTPAQLFRAVRPGAVPAGVARPRRSCATLVGHVDLALGDSELQPAGARGARVSADRRACRSRSTPSRITRPVRRPGARADPGRRARQLPVRRPDRARTRRSRITSGWPSTTSATSTRTTASSSSGATTWCRATMRRFAR